MPLGGPLAGRLAPHRLQPAEREGRVGPVTLAVDGREGVAVPLAVRRHLGPQPGDLGVGREPVGLLGTLDHPVGQSFLVSHTRSPWCPHNWIPSAADSSIKRSARADAEVCNSPD